MSNFLVNTTELITKRDVMRSCGPIDSIRDKKIKRLVVVEGVKPIAIIICVSDYERIYNHPVILSMFKQQHLIHDDKGRLAND